MTEYKKFLLFLTGTVLYGVGISIYMYVTEAFDLRYVLLFLYFLVFTLFSIRKVVAEKIGEPADDEMTLEIKSKAKVKAFDSSTLIWVVIYVVFDVKSEVLITGLLGMILLYALNFYSLSKRGSTLDY